MNPRPLRDLPRRAGFGLKPEHYADVLAAAEQGSPPAWAEIHPPELFRRRRASAPVADRDRRSICR